MYKAAGRLESCKLQLAQGIVTNTTDVKPLITVATYLHDASGCEVYQEITGRTFMPMIEPPQHLKNMRATGKSTQNLVLQTRGSKFIKFQEVRIQELADEARPILWLGQTRVSPVTPCFVLPSRVRCLLSQIKTTSHKHVHAIWTWQVSKQQCSGHQAT